MTRESEAFNSKARRVQRKLARRQRMTEKVEYELHVLLDGKCGRCKGLCTVDTTEPGVRNITTQWGRGGSASDAWHKTDAPEAGQEDTENGV